MTRERFKLLYDLHHSREEAIKRSIGVAEARRRDLVGRHDELAATRDIAARGVEENLAMRETFVRYWHRIGEEMAEMTKRITACDQEIDALRRDLAEAHRQVAAFAKLRERDRQVAVRRADRRQARFLDDFALRQRERIGA